MQRISPLLAVTLVLLLLGLSFNAYACLLPLNGAPAGAMEKGCPSTDEPSARQICDSFTTLGVQATTQVNPAIDSQSVCHDETASLFSPLSLSACASQASDYPVDAARQNLLAKISVLRL